MAAEVLPLPRCLAAADALAEARALLEQAYELTRSERVQCALVQADLLLEAIQETA